MQKTKWKKEFAGEMPYLAHDIDELIKILKYEKWGISSAKVALKITKVILEKGGIKNAFDIVTESGNKKWYEPDLKTAWEYTKLSAGITALVGSGGAAFAASALLAGNDLYILIDDSIDLHDSGCVPK
jgi:hypothetical protein